MRSYSLYSRVSSIYVEVVVTIWWSGLWCSGGFVGGLIYSVYCGPSVLFSSVASVSGGPLQGSECAWICEMTLQVSECAWICEMTLQGSECAWICDMTLQGSECTWICEMTLQGSECAWICEISGNI
jgi:hypothetical protein